MAGTIQVVHLVIEGRMDLSVVLLQQIPLITDAKEIVPGRLLWHLRFFRRRCLDKEKLPVSVVVVYRLQPASQSMDPQPPQDETTYSKRCDAREKSQQSLKPDTCCSLYLLLLNILR